MNEFSVQVKIQPMTYRVNLVCIQPMTYRVNLVCIQPMTYRVNLLCPKIEIGIRPRTHDELTGKNDNPDFQHITQAEKTAFAAKLSDAPSDGTQYARQNGVWTEVDTLIEENKDKHYVHDQGMPSTGWTCTHNLGKFPSVTVIDSSKTIVEGNVEYINLNQVEIEFNSKFSGEAYFN